MVKIFNHTACSGRTSSLEQLLLVNIPNEDYQYTLNLMFPNVQIFRKLYSFPIFHYWSYSLRVCVLLMANDCYHGYRFCSTCFAAYFFQGKCAHSRSQSGTVPTYGK